MIENDAPKAKYGYDSSLVVKSFHDLHKSTIFILYLPTSFSKTYSKFV